MAHFAKISEENIVLNVLRLDDKDASTEEAGQQYLETHSNWPANLWIQTSYNTWKNQHGLGGTPLRGNYAAVGFEWDSENQIFWKSDTQGMDEKIATLLPLDFWNDKIYAATVIVL